MAQHPRIDELRRRVEKDPASIAFAQLAEEHRRAGDHEEAIRVARSGLAQHPGYLSARVTLGRALLEVGEYDEAQAELEQVLRVAPDNLAAIRALADIHQRREDTPHHEPAPEPAAADTASLPASEEQLAQALRGLDFAVDPPSIESVPTEAPPAVDPVVPELEDWLAAILADRERRAVKAKPPDIS